MIPGAAKTDGTRLPDSQCGQKGGLATASAIAAMSGKTVCCKFCYFKLFKQYKKITFQFQPKVYHSGSDSVPIHTKLFLLWEKLSVELDSNYDIFKPLVENLTY